MTIKKYSWEKLEKNILVKNLDYSSFHEHATAIPQDFYSFFNISIQGKESLQLLLTSDHLVFSAAIRTRLKPHKRKDIKWDADFSDYLKEKFPDWKNIEAGEKTSNMKLAFIKTNNSNTYQVLTNPSHSEVIEITELIKITQHKDITETERFRLTKSRIAQGLYRSNLMQIESECRVTRLTDSNYLIASHIKPWSHSNDNEKLDGNNGLLLSPHIDKLFDNGHISFSNNGDMLISSKINPDVLSLWSIDKDLNVGGFNKQQQGYLEYHRSTIFRR
jgi:hypothetical protein